MFGFSDETYIDVASGNGGNGCVSFRREICVPKGGPDGGDGGRGGDVVFVVKPNLRTLDRLKMRRSYRAENGQNGGGARCFGRDGRDVIVEVPAGTVIKNAQTGEIIQDLTDYYKDKGQTYHAWATGTSAAPPVRRPVLPKRGRKGRRCGWASSC